MGNANEVPQRKTSNKTKAWLEWCETTIAGACTLEQMPVYDITNTLRMTAMPTDTRKGSHTCKCNMNAEGTHNETGRTDD